MPKKAGEWEAKADELTDRGTPYRYGERDFPPGEWVEIDDTERERLQSQPALTVRKRKADGATDG
jgi:hypothetical protein